jgi:hypothetical protein
VSFVNAAAVLFAYNRASSKCHIPYLVAALLALAVFAIVIDATMLGEAGSWTGRVRLDSGIASPRPDENYVSEYARFVLDDGQPLPTFSPR